MPPRHLRRRAATAAGVVVIDTLPVVAMTDARTRRVHLVPDAAFAAGRANARRCVTVCGVAVFAASVTTPEAA